eukprot:6211916-Pleurochrysis_carterae.AAC.2
MSCLHYSGSDTCCICHPKVPCKYQYKYLLTFARKGHGVTSVAPRTMASLATAQQIEIGAGAGAALTASFYAAVRAVIVLSSMHGDQ